MDNISKDNIICKNTDLFIKVEELFYEYFPILKEYDTSFLSGVEKSEGLKH